MLNDVGKESRMDMKQNRRSMRRCLVCNVNLCPVCENEFHGIDTSHAKQMFGRVATSNPKI